MTQKPMLRVEVGALGARQAKNYKGGVLDRRSSARRLCECAWVIQPRRGFLVFCQPSFCGAPPRGYLVGTADSRVGYNSWIGVVLCVGGNYPPITRQKLPQNFNLRSETS